ncbi:MAG: peptidylprolyl isomerase [Hyphomicrobium sp.]|jgi:peptidylprolyl isomerase
MTIQFAVLRRLAGALVLSAMATSAVAQQDPQTKKPRSAAQTGQTGDAAVREVPTKAAAAGEAAGRTSPVGPTASVATTGADDDLVVARLGSSDIKVSEVRSFVSTMSAQNQATLARDANLLNQTVRVMLTNQAVLKEALEKKWDQDPSVVAQLKSVREATLVESYQQSVSLPPDSYPSSSEVEAFYEGNKASLLVPRRFQLAQIYISSPKGVDATEEEKAGKKLEEVQKKLKQPGADFAAIARSDSEERQSGEKGGEIGWLAESQIKPEVRAQVLALAKGAVSEPIRTDDGWQVLKLMDTKESHTLPLSEVREALAQRLRQERAAALRRAYLAKIIEQNPLAINELALSKVLTTAKK